MELPGIVIKPKFETKARKGIDFNPNVNFQEQFHF